MPYLEIWRKNEGQEPVRVEKVYFLSESQLEHLAGPSVNSEMIRALLGPKKGFKAHRHDCVMIYQITKDPL